MSLGVRVEIAKQSRTNPSRAKSSNTSRSKSKKETGFQSKEDGAIAPSGAAHTSASSAVPPLTNHTSLLSGSLSLSLLEENAVYI